MSPEELEKQKQEQEKKEAENKELKAALSNMQSELIEMRKGRQEDRKALDALLKGDADKDTATPTDTVEKLFREEKKAQAAKNLAKAESKFKLSKTEFNPSNDPGGIKYKAFEKELSKFSLDGLEEPEDYLERFEEVYEFMNRKSKTTTENANIYTGGGSSSSTTAPKESDMGGELSKVELKLIQNNGWSRDRYLKLKTKQPAYINNLLKYLD